MKIIQGLGINKIYGEKDTEVHAVNNIDIEIHSGEFLMIVGASGSGKSTLLHILGGIDNPTSGKVFIQNIDIFSLKTDELAVFRRRNIGFIFQSFNLIPVLTARENILLPLELDNADIDYELFEDIVDTLLIRNKLSHFPSELSGGEQQRIAIARALMTKPQIIFADEPTGNLDKKNTREVMNLLSVFSNKYGVTVVMITHNLSLATLADRIIKIEDGKIVRD